MSRLNYITLDLTLELNRAGSSCITQKQKFDSYISEGTNLNTIYSRLLNNIKGHILNKYICFWLWITVFSRCLQQCIGSTLLDSIHLADNCIYIYVCWWFGISWYSSSPTPPNTHTNVRTHTQTNKDLFRTPENSLSGYFSKLRKPILW